MLNTAKVGDKLRVASDLNLPWYGSIEWNMEENFRMEWKISSIYMEWKKIASMEYRKIVFHSIPCPDVRVWLGLKLGLERGLEFVLGLGLGLG